MHFVSDIFCNYDANLGGIDVLERNQLEFVALGGAALLIDILTTSRDEELSNAVKSVLHRCINRGLVPLF